MLWKGETSRLAVAAAAVLVLGQAAAAEPRLELAPNFNTCSVYVYLDSLARPDQATLEYRSGAEDPFRPGHPLSATGKKRFAGSIFHLKPDQPLEVRVTIAGGGGPKPLVITGRTRTAAESFPAATGNTYYVGPAGSDRGPGTRARPLKTISRAVRAAGPGDRIVLLDGLSQQTIIRKSGRPDAYITIAGEAVRGKARPTLTGGQVVEELWNPADGGVYVAIEKRRVNTVTGPKGRLYHHGSLGALRQAPAPLKAGWWHDAPAGRIYVRLPGGKRPGTRDIRVGIVPVALRFENAAYWIVEGVNFTQFGGTTGSKGIDINNSHHIVVRNCRFQYMRTGIAVRKQGAHHCLLERNTFVDDGIWTWPWKACKGHDVEGSAVSCAGGQANVVRFNTVTGTFNGIAVSTWGDLTNEALNRDLDIHDNQFRQIGDDPLEPEGACMNVRFWNNTTISTLQGISLAPITVGPVYVVRDRYLDFKGGAVKVSNNSRGPVFLYHILGWTKRERSNAMSASGKWDNMHFRNCILRGTRYVIEDYHAHPLGCSYDYCCLFSTDKQFVKWSNRRYWDPGELPPAKAFGRHILRLEPYYAAGATGPDGQLLPVDERLIDAGAAIPGINDDFKGKAPDIGPIEVK